VWAEKHHIGTRSSRTEKEPMKLEGEVVGTRKNAWGVLREGSLGLNGDEVLTGTASYVLGSIIKRVIEDKIDGRIRLDKKYKNLRK